MAFIFSLQVVTFTSQRLRDYVILQPHWIYCTIIGRLLSEYPLPPPYVTYDRNGCAKLADVERILTTDDVAGDFTVDMAHDCGLLIKRKEIIVVPAKIAVSHPDFVWALSSRSINAGRRLVCKGATGISSALFPLLQAYLHEFFMRNHNVQIPLWKNGLFVALPTLGAAQAIVQACPGRRWIDVIVGGSANNGIGCSELLHLLVQKILKLADELSPGSQLEKRYLSSQHLDTKLSADSFADTTSCVAFSQRNVKLALSSRGYVSGGESPPEEVDGLLLSEDEARGENE